MQSDGCICEGNWRQIVKETEPLIGKRFRDPQGKEYTLFGVVHGGYDYYYGMSAPGETRLLSCVGSLETHGFEVVNTGKREGAGRKKQLPPCRYLYRNQTTKLKRGLGNGL